MLHKTLVTLAAAVALGCVPVATNALAASHPSNHANATHAAAGHVTGRHSMAGYVRGVMLPDTGAATAMERSTMDRSMTAALATATATATATADARATVVLSAG